MIKDLLSLSLMLLLGQVLIAQNLVPNNSFENYYRLNDLPADRLSNVRASQFYFKKYKPKNENDCPIYGVWTYLLCKDWTNCSDVLNLDTPDLYNKCSIEQGVPFSYYVLSDKTIFSSYQNAKSGVGYMGIVLIEARVEKIKDEVFIGNEFLQAKLIRPLERDKKYYTEFYVNRADFSTVSTDKLGLFFSKKEIKVKDKIQMFKYKPQISNPNGIVIEDTVNWIKISGAYIAQGGEQFIIIGDFFPEKENTIKHDRKKTKDFICYYYIDDVSVVLIEDSLKNEPKAIPTSIKDTSSDSIDLKNIKVGVPVILKSIYFALGKSNLLPASFEELDRLARFMKDNPFARIEVSGYTDDTGTDDFNMQLSIARAKSVADYLIHQGIAKDRIDYKGFGKTKPASENNTGESKSLNRRVELKFIRK
jgi:Outer membrane protein and related peptidoglycan-associated (lipo)proteins